MPLLVQLGALGVPALTLTTALVLNRPASPPDPFRTSTATSPITAAPSQAPRSASPSIAQQDGELRRSRPNLAQDRIHGELLAYARREIRLAWKEELAREPTEEQVESLLAEYIALLENSPHALGTRGAKEHAEILAAAEMGGPLFEIVTRLDLGHADPRVDVVLDSERFASLFGSTPAAATLDAQHLEDLSDVLVEGATLLLPPGVYRLERLMHQSSTFPPHVTLAGAGMDATLVLLEQQLYTRGPVVDLAFRDLTIHANDNYLFDLRHEPASVRMDRVRLIGFDKGAGASCAFGTQELALLARDCIFEGGYGRSPGSGKVFDVRTPGLLARFERCRFDLVALPFARIRSGAHVVLEDCSVTRDLNWGGPGAAEQALQSNPGLRLIDTRIDYFYGSGERQPVPHKDLGLLFPDWESRLAR